jgi:sRNA-binding carbon storage regulator CsrA
MEITLIEVQGDEVRIGVKAPREAVVEGREMWKQMPPEAGGAPQSAAGER